MKRITNSFGPTWSPTSSFSTCAQCAIFALRARLVTRDMGDKPKGQQSKAQQKCEKKNSIKESKRWKITTQKKLKCEKNLLSDFGSTCRIWVALPEIFAIISCGSWWSKLPSKAWKPKPFFEEPDKYNKWDVYKTTNRIIIPYECMNVI